jgi:predicted amidohydrolase
VDYDSAPEMKTPIACGQFASSPGDVGANIALIRAQAAEAAARSAVLIVFPELCLSGYLGAEDVKRCALGVDSAEVRALAGAAKDIGIALCFGFAEKSADGEVYNSMMYVDAAGVVGSVYRKVHLFEGESRWARAGGSFTGFDAGPFRAGLWICYDTRFPEAARTLAVDGVTCVLAGTAWLGPAEEWELAVRARAMDNGMYVAGAALQGGSGGQECHGSSLIADPHGRVVARGTRGRNQIIVADYDSEEVRAFRARLPLLRHRRPGAYAPQDRAADWPS